MQSKNFLFSISSLPYIVNWTLISLSLLSFGLLLFDGGVKVHTKVNNVPKLKRTKRRE